MFDILDCFWKHCCVRDFSLDLSYFLTNIGALVLVKRFFDCFHSTLLNSIVYDLYILPIPLFNRERCEELYLLFLMTRDILIESLWLHFVRDIIMIAAIFLGVVYTASLLPRLIQRFKLDIS